MILSWSSPSLNKIRVGMLITSKRRESSSCSSMLSLAIRSLPGWSLAMSSRTGAIILQGPHHSAQKSTRTGRSEPLISSSKFCSVSNNMPAPTDSHPPRSNYLATAINNRVTARIPTPSTRLPLGRRLAQIGRGLASGLKPPLGINCRHTTRPGGGDRLPVDVILDVARPEDAFDVGPCPVMGEDVAGLVHIELAGKEIGVGGMPDRHKQTGHRQIGLLVGDDIAKPDPLDLVVADH